MSLFDALVVGHLVGDFLFQTSWMARLKSSKWIPLSVHVCAYTIAVVLSAWPAGGIPLWAVAWIWITHFSIDHATLGGWWAKTIQGVVRKEDAWLSIVADQALHVIVLAIVAWGTTGGFHF